jgi:hypothetical protein
VLCGLLALPALIRIDRRGMRNETPAAPTDAQSLLTPSG